MAKGTLVILGSGEIAPSMVKVYREVLEHVTPRRGVMLDTPFGFQENIPQLTAKIIEYFHTSLQFNMESASFLNFECSSQLERAMFIEGLLATDFVFAGPGSPSYAMRQWGPLDLAEPLSRVLERGGVVCFSSAAALTLGRYTAPIYELYKVGEAPFWLDGLDLLGRIGLSCAVIPHFDNAEGGNHDTRFCYLGERRLRLLESMLDDEIATLGVDEHTAIIFDLDRDTYVVRGRGHAYWRHGAHQRTLEKDSQVGIDELRNSTAAAIDDHVASHHESDSIKSLGESAAAGGVEAIAALARLVRLAEQGGVGRIDPSSLVEGVLRARSKARSSGQYELADELRLALVDGGIEVHDGVDGVTWTVHES